ncbi:MCM family protein [Heterostelium album PN500]|uniref:DNA helicase n=1 Tax=Heterostelium pallidum (strain ATCC 26659 / Pp 5 / PN500) TaxID=670386 RepID=D3B491_HETP5|nr:MCM family protein [Heterostelium album PN500]EFA84139.1 MCM family protein [Heterostelium album PN500]|eukprot:XP_020436256.1 MCM family protein [Heterostelium album PN500]
MYTLYDFENFTREEILDFFTKLLIAHYPQQIESIMLKQDQSIYHSLQVEFPMILEGDVNFGPLFIAEPRKLLPLFHEALLISQERIKALYTEGGVNVPVNRNTFNAHSNTSQQQQQQQVFNPSQLTIKKNCRVRVSELPICREIRKSFLPRSNEYGLFVEFRGTVIRTGSTKIVERSKYYVCTKCKESFKVHIDYEQHNQFDVPKRCPNPRRCENQYFKPMQDGSSSMDEHCDYQEIKLQENIHQIGAGTIPRSIMVILQEDLVDSCQAGDDIIVSGVVIRRWRPLKTEERCEVEMVLLANNVRVMNEQRFGAGLTDELKCQFEDFWIAHEANPLVGRNLILRSVCSGVYGMFVVKLALMLVMIGGVSINDRETNTKRRGECHMLLVGEPGTGKSQFLKYAAKVASRSVLTTGIGTTSAGLTAAVVKEQGGEMMLEAGALVLADGGVCCIDEFSGINEKDRATIHEAMEQQTISIAKAGIITSLHTRCSIIAATNAKGKYDEQQSLMVNTNLASPLLSRFDIILIITDDQEPEWDRMISEFILRRGQPLKESDDKFWNENLQSYLYYIKNTFNPTLSEDSKLLLDAYFQKQRTGATQRNEARITTRLLESLIRLSQAHARLMFRNVVEIQDAIFAIYMIECSAESSCILTCLNAQQSRFPEDPEHDYKQIERAIKNSLGLYDISYNPSKRKKTKPKETFHTVNKSWINSNYDDDEEEEEVEDDGNEADEENEEETEQVEEVDEVEEVHAEEEVEEVEEVEAEEPGVFEEANEFIRDDIIAGGFVQPQQSVIINDQEASQHNMDESDISFRLDIDTTTSNSSNDNTKSKGSGNNNNNNNSGKSLNGNVVTTFIDDEDMFNDLSDNIIMKRSTTPTTITNNNKNNNNNNNNKQQQQKQSQTTRVNKTTTNDNDLDGIEFDDDTVEISQVPVSSQARRSQVKHLSSQNSTQFNESLAELQREMDQQQESSMNWEFSPEVDYGKVRSDDQLPSDEEIEQSQVTTDNHTSHQQIQSSTTKSSMFDDDLEDLEM